jgi:hypothetical protein
MKFDKPTSDKILKDIEDEVPYELACESNGISYNSFRNWIANGKRDIEDGKNSYYAQFLQAIRDIQKKRVRKYLKEVGHNDKGHKGAEWILERAYWKYFSPKVGEIELNERVEALEQKKGMKDDNENKERKNDSSKGE